MAGSITRHVLKQHLANRPLVAAIRQKAEMDLTKKSLHEALLVMQDAGISEAAQIEIAGKIEEYKNISKNYGALIEDTWHITWQTESIIRKYLDHDMNDLPEIAKF